MKLKCLLISLLSLSFVSHAYCEDLTPLELGKKLRFEADAGDANAMYQLAMHLVKHAPKKKRPYTICDGKLVNPLIRQNLTGKDCKTIQDPKNRALLSDWKPVGTRNHVAGWITKAAERGNENAIRLKCEMGSDASAPAEMRESAQQWCAKL